jgi:thiamine biosynthesis lipoprotein
MLVGGKYLTSLLGEKQTTVRETRMLMGTVINLAVVAESKLAGEAAVAATFAELERQIGIFDHRTDGTPVAMLNQAGVLDNPPTELVDVLTQARTVSEMTGGAFDITVKPLVDLYKQAQPDLPDESAVKAALALVDYRQVEMGNTQVAFALPGMAITLDGIAKGYIVDAGVAELKRLGYPNVYVEAGGDLMAAGEKESALPWKVGVQSPRQTESGILASFNLSDQAVATSGDYMQYYSPDMRYHHIIDPRVGVSPAELASVSIFSERAALSDALATGVMVLGIEAGMQLIEQIARVEGFLVDKALVEYQSAGLSVL